MDYFKLIHDDRFFQIYKEEELHLIRGRAYRRDELPTKYSYGSRLTYIKPAAVEYVTQLANKMKVGDKINLADHMDPEICWSVMSELELPYFKWNPHTNILHRKGAVRSNKEKRKRQLTKHRRHLVTHVERYLLKQLGINLRLTNPHQHDTQLSAVALMIQFKIPSRLVMGSWSPSEKRRMASWIKEKKTEYKQLLQTS